MSALLLPCPQQYVLRNAFDSFVHLTFHFEQLGILAHAFPPSRTRSVAFATFAAGSPVGAAIGLLVGGALAQLTQ